MNPQLPVSVSIAIAQSLNPLCLEYGVSDWSQHSDAVLTDQLSRFCVDSVLTLMDNNKIAACFAAFLHNLSNQLWKLGDELITVDLEDIGYRLEDGLMVGYLQFETSSIRGV